MISASGVPVFSITDVVILRCIFSPSLFSFSALSRAHSFVRTLPICVNSLAAPASPSPSTTSSLSTLGKYAPAPTISVFSPTSVFIASLIAREI